MSTPLTSDDELGQAVAEVLPEARAVYLFGSCATPAAGPGSDVDLAVLAEEPIAPDRLAQARLGLAERLRRDVDLLDLRQASTVMRAQVISTGRLLADEDPAFRALREHFEATAYAAYARLGEERRGVLERIQREGRIHGR